MTISTSPEDLKLSSYDFKLPQELIASRPIEGRHHSKLLVYLQSEDRVIHSTFRHLSEFLPRRSHLVLNQSKVFPCRLIGSRPSGGQVELFVLSLVPTKERVYPCLIKSSRKKRLQDEFLFGPLCASIVSLNSDGTFGVKFNMKHLDLCHFLEEHGKIPIPPYIRKGEADERDRQDYQTIYAKESGSVAAPTAGLHFTQEVFQDLKGAGIEHSFVTLHVGAGTFRPVTSEDIRHHQMHSEFFAIDRDHLLQIQKHRDHLIAVGTTSLRTLESCFHPERGVELPGGDPPYSTDLFLYPGVEVRTIKGLITNFHLPQSSLLMLVSSLIGREKTLSLYSEAIEQRYRFFSYGDAMLILRN